MRVTSSIVLLVAIAASLAVGPVFAKKGVSAGSKADYRSAKSGKYVKKDYAVKNKSTTVREERKKN